MTMSFITQRNEVEALAIQVTEKKPPRHNANDGWNHWRKATQMEKITVMCWTKIIKYGWDWNMTTDKAIIAKYPVYKNNRHNVVPRFQVMTSSLCAGFTLLAEETVSRSPLSCILPRVILPYHALMKTSRLAVKSNSQKLMERYNILATG